MEKSVIRPVQRDGRSVEEERRGEGRGVNKLFHDSLLQHIEGLPGLTGFTMMQVQFSLEEMHFTKILCILAPFLDNLVEDITIEIVHFIHSHQFWCDC